MNKVQLIRNSTPGIELTLKPDWFVLSDAAAHAAVPLKDGKQPCDIEKVKIFIDHETPCGSEKVAAEQKKLINFAKETGCQLFNGYGINYQLMLDKYVQPGQLIVHCGDFGSIYGSCDSFAIKLSPEEMSEALVSGEVSIVVPETVCLELIGELSAGASAKDAALCALKLLGNVEGKILAVCGTGFDSLIGAERIAFFQMLSGCGCMAAIPGFSASVTQLRLDLGAVVPVVSCAENFSEIYAAAEMTDKNATAVFIGGCSTGRIEDIRTVAAIAKGKKVSRKVRATIAFASTEVYIQAANERLIAQLLDAGCIVMNQGCSACYAHSQGLVDNKDMVLSAGSRPCPDCLGGGNAKTYLCSASTAMASAIAGHICVAE